jgi:hypothetical protein
MILTSAKMNVKQLAFLLAISIVLVSASAAAQVKFAITAGPVFSTVRGKAEDGMERTAERTAGLRLGLTAEITLVRYFSLQPAIHYSGKGFREDGNWFAGEGNGFTVSARYLELPVHLVYSPSLGPGKILLGAGPYAAYGTGGKWKAERDVVIGDIMIPNRGDVVFKQDAMDGEFGSYTYGKPLDFGVSFIAGYEFRQRVSLSLTAQTGLADLEPRLSGKRSAARLYNSALGIALGYSF